MEQQSTHFLMIGEGDDIPMIKALLDRLPVDGYGQVIIEVSTPRMVEYLDAPPGIAVTWLFRTSGRDADALVRPRGELVAGALRGWVAEWLPGDSFVPVVLWVGCMGSEYVDAVYQELRTALPELHLHHPHYDQTPGE